jgi:hypothetical protein
MAVMGERPSEYIRDANDWYVEPVWAVEALKKRVPMVDVHDPCCGMGTIPRVFKGTGADLMDRGYGYPVTNFRLDETPRRNIVTNPPYRIAQFVIEHALKLAQERVAALVQMKFLCSQKRYNLFSRSDMERVIVFSRRPSMPPGQMLETHGESIRGGGSIDFCWAVWNKNHNGPTQLEWLK